LCAISAPRHRVPSTPAALTERFFLPVDVGEQPRTGARGWVLSLVNILNRIAAGFLIESVPQNWATFKLPVSPQVENPGSPA